MPLLCATAARALTAPIETTLRQLLGEYSLDDGGSLLLSIKALSDNLAHFNIECLPPIGSLGLDDKRVLSHKSPGSVVIALEEISLGETAQVEFKSTLLLDVKRRTFQPGLALKEYANQTLLHSVLKTIAAFANCDGGTLYIGVGDDLEIYGLEQDFALVNEQRSDYDGWDQFLRAQMASQLFDGRVVSTYVRSTCLKHDDKSFVRLQIAPRSDLTFLKKENGACSLYVRSGTSSQPIEYHEIQKHYEMRRKF